MKNLIYLLHGENPSRVNLILIYAIGCLGAGIIVYRYHLNFSLLSNIVLGIISLDLIGGVIANLTDSTKKWWQKQPSRIQYGFLIAHTVQPFLIVIFLGVEFTIMAILFLYVLIIGIILINLKGEVNRILSVSAAGVGIIGFLEFCDLNLFNWLMIIYILKLIIGFCIKIGK